MNINYIKFGKGSKTMVILPGVALKSVLLNKEAIINSYKLFEDEFTTYLFEVRDDIPEGCDTAMMADDLVSRFAELGLKHVYLYGVSLGGMIGQMILWRHPQYLNKMVICSSAGDFEDKTNFYNWLDLAERKDIRGLVDDFCKKVYSDEFYTANIEVLQQYFADTSDEELNKFIKCLKAVYAHDVSGIVNETGVPIKQFGSKTDRVFHYEDMLKLAKQLKAETYFYEDGSHAIYDEKADIKERIKEFFIR